MRPALLLLLVACTRPTPPAPAPAPLRECTLQTPLVPGVPGSPGHLIVSEINPNGASELATLMREMKSDLEEARAAILAGKPVAPMFARHRMIRCTWATVAEDRNAKFDASAIAYIDQLKAFDAKPADPRAAYEAVIGGCLACHAHACPGPIAAIKTLSFPPDSR